MTKLAIKNILLKTFTVAAFATLATSALNSGRAQAVVVNVKTIPESSNILGTLAAVGLGATLLYKQKHR